MSDTRSLKFEGLDAGVSLDVDQRLLDALPVVFANWPFEVEPGTSGAEFCNICFKDRRYHVSSPFMGEPVVHKDPVNTLCSLIVELAWAHLRQAPGLLCLHGAAVEMAGRLVVFPSTRRAGKSTLSVAMLAAGHKLYTDDFLPLKLDHDNQICGLSHGISPRLRLPVPQQFGDHANSYVNARSGIRNRQYRYVMPNAGEMARFGDGALLGALVFLEQKPGFAPSMRKIGQADTLKILIKQNFSRAMNAAGILQVLAAIAAKAPAYMLQFDEVGAAIALLEQRFDNWKTAAPKLDVSDHGIFSVAPDPSSTAPAADWQTCQIEQTPGVTDIAVENERFLAGASGREIHHLNSTAAIIWQLVAEPASLTEISAMLASVFPGQAKDQLERDASATLRLFISNNLVQPAVGIGARPQNPVAYLEVGRR